MCQINKKHTLREDRERDHIGTRSKPETATLNDAAATLNDATATLNDATATLNDATATATATAVKMPRRIVEQNLKVGNARAQMRSFQYFAISVSNQNVAPFGDVEMFAVVDWSGFIQRREVPDMSACPVGYEISQHPASDRHNRIMLIPTHIQQTAVLRDTNVGSILIGMRGEQLRNVNRRSALLSFTVKIHAMRRHGTETADGPRSLTSIAQVRPRHGGRVDDITPRRFAGSSRSVLYMFAISVSHGLADARLLPPRVNFALPSSVLRIQGSTVWENEGEGPATNGYT
jgi:hypothetical protein